MQQVNASSGPGSRADVEASIVLFSSQRSEHALEVLEELLKWIQAEQRRVELVISLDHERRPVYERIRGRIAGLPDVKLLILHSHGGQLATIRAGAAVCSSPMIVTFPAYPQIACDSIPRVIEALKGGADYVIGYRERRRDSLTNRLSGRLFNLGMGLAAGLRFRDIACSVHGFRREVLDAVPDYGDTQVFLPIMAHREGFEIREVALRQHPAEPRLRIFGPRVFVNRFLSLLTIGFLVRFTQKPLRPIGLVGGLLFLAGGVLGLVLTYQRLFLSVPLAGRPMLLLALLLVTAGIQIIVLGLLGELLLYLHFRDHAIYRVAERAGRTDEGERKE